MSMPIAEFLEHRYGVELAPDDESLAQQAERVVGKGNPEELTRDDLIGLMEDANRQKRAAAALAAFHSYTAEGLKTGGHETLEDSSVTEKELLRRLDALMEEHGFSVEGEAPVPIGEVIVPVQEGD